MALRPTTEKSVADKKADRKAAQDEVLMREIDDAVRQDELANFAKTYGRPLLALLIVGILAFGGYLFWQSREESRLEKQSENLVAALDQAQAGNLNSAGDIAASLAAEADGGAATSARMLRASVAIQEGRNDEAVAIYSEVSADDDAPPALRDLATIRGTALGFDQLAPEEVVTRLKPLAVPGNPWFGSAGELVAMAYLEQGNREQAGTLFGEIAKSEEVPESLRSRARQMAGLLGVDAIEDVEELLESQGISTAGAQDSAAAQ